MSKQTVLKVLTEYPETREDSRLCTMRVWQHEGMPVTAEQLDSLAKCSQATTITRLMKHIQNTECRLQPRNRKDNG